MELSEKRKQQKREYYIKNKERILKQMREKQKTKLSDATERAKYCEDWREYTRNHYEARLLTSIKSKCKIKGIPFNLELTDIVIPETCPKTGIPLVIHKERGKYIDTPSVDRIDPTKGYTKDNIQIVSYWYNVAKLTWDEPTFVAMCRRVVDIHGELCQA